MPWIIESGIRHHRPSKAQTASAVPEVSPDVGPLYEHERVMSPVAVAMSTLKKNSASSSKAPILADDDDVEKPDPVRLPRSPCLFPHADLL